MQADVDRFRRHALAREIEVGAVIAAELGAEVIAVAGDALERRPQQAFAEPPAIEGRGVDEVHAQVERGVDRPHGLVEIDRAEFLAERRCPVADPREVQAGLAKGAEFHRDTFGLNREIGRGRGVVVIHRWMTRPGFGRAIEDLRSVARRSESELCRFSTPEGSRSYSRFAPERGERPQRRPRRQSPTLAHAGGIGPGDGGLREVPDGPPLPRWAQGGGRSRASAWPACDTVADHRKRLTQVVISLNGAVDSGRRRGSRPIAWPSPAGAARSRPGRGSKC